MSYNIFINSSVLNFGVNDREEIKKVLNSVENPQWHTDENYDIIIDKDFDRRHVTAIIKYLEER